jgi:hypothetical protein
MRAGRVLLLLGLALAGAPAAQGQPVPLEDGRPAPKKARHGSKWCDFG